MKTLFFLVTFIRTFVSVALSRAPSIVTDQPGNHTLHVGDSLSLDCQLSRSKVIYPFTITWLKHYRTKNKVQRVTKISSSIVTSSTRTNSALLLKNVTEQDSGFYSCKIKNKYGGDISTGFVNVTQKKELRTVQLFSLKKSASTVLISAASVAFIFFFLFFVVSFLYFSPRFVFYFPKTTLK